MKNQLMIKVVTCIGSALFYWWSLGPLTCYRHPDDDKYLHLKIQTTATNVLEHVTVTPMPNIVDHKLRGSGGPAVQTSAFCGTFATLILEHLQQRTSANQL